MHLNDLPYLHSIDSQNALQPIDAFPDQIAEAWQLAQALALPEAYRSVTHIVFAGMGEAAMGGALTQALVAPACPVPVTVWRNYTPPAYVGPNTLVVGLSHSGDNEELLSAGAQAVERGAKLLAITTGGQLATFAQTHNAPVWLLPQASPRRATLGYMFLWSLAVLVKLGLIADPTAEVTEAVEALRAQQDALRATTPIAGNPAKRMAGQLMDRMGAIFAADYLAPVARHWRNQLAQMGKAWSVYDELPEMDHNAIVGLMYPEGQISKHMVLFLRSSHAHPRNQLRADITRELYMTAGFNTDVIEARGASPLAHMLTALHFGDYTAYYLAMCYGVDPTPLPPIDYVKNELAQHL